MQRTLILVLGPSLAAALGFSLLLLGGQTLYILEVHPAGYAALAANEAEKASPISIIEVRPFGAFGRVWLGGTESHIAEASKAAIAAIEAVGGRANP